MKKAFLIMMTLVMVFASVGCGKKDDGEVQKEVTMEPSEIETKLKEALGEDIYLCNTDMTEDDLTNIHGFDLSQIESYVAKCNNITSINPDTVIILKVKDGYADTAMEKLNELFASKVNYARLYSYGAAKVLNARLYRSGNYVAMILAGTMGELGMSEEDIAAQVDTGYTNMDAVWKDIFGNIPENSAVIPEEKENQDGGLPGGLPGLGG